LNNEQEKINFYLQQQDFLSWQPQEQQLQQLHPPLQQEQPFVLFAAFFAAMAAWAAASLATGSRNGEQLT